MARAFAASGESKMAFAKRHGLGPERVRRWLARLAERERQRGPTFAPVRLIERAAEPRGGGVEIVVGTRVVRVGAGFCKETLRQVVAALEEAAC